METTVYEVEVRDSHGIFDRYYLNSYADLKRFERLTAYEILRVIDRTINVE